MKYLLYRRSATIKEKISTQLVSRPLSTMLPEHVLMSHRAHCFIIDVQPSFPCPCVAISVRVKNINHIVLVACRFAVVVEHYRAYNAVALRIVEDWVP
jgi:hypothetical protein